MNSPTTSYRYQYWVRAYLLPGGWTGWSDYDLGVRKGPIPSPPTHWEASDGTYAAYVHVDWPRYSSFGKYKVGRGPIGVWPPTISWETDLYQTDYDDYTAVCTNHYGYALKGQDWCGQWSDWGSPPDEGYRKAAKPAEPDNLAASYCTYPDKVRITWESVECASEYVLRRHTERFPLTPKEEVYRDGETAFDDTDVDPGRTYYYWAYACNEAGCQGTEGLPASGRACPAPTNVEATDCTYPGKVRVTWNSVPGASKYQVFRAVSSGGAKTQVGQVSAPTTEFDDTSVTPDKVYHYWVKACFDNGCSDVSAFSNRDKGEACCEAPPVPSNLDASDGVYTDKIRVAWDGIAGATYYEVYRAASLSGSKTKIGSPTGTWLDDTSAPCGSISYYG